MTGGSAGPQGGATTSLDGVGGRGYGVVESLPALGKGRRCTGIFVTGAEHRERFEAARRERRRVPFRGPVHRRHVSEVAELDVEVVRVMDEADGVAVEFTAPGLR